jgi:hypothetical protein
MNSDEIPAEVRDFLESCIDSVEQLRVILLLREDPARDWSAAELAHELRSTESSIGKRLAGLYERGVLVRPASAARHRFAPASPAVARVVGELDEIHQKRPYRVIDIIYSRAPDALTAFADAFRIRRKE